MVPERSLDGNRFSFVPDVGRGPMRVDVLHARRFDTRITHRISHHTIRAVPILWRRGDVMSVGTQSISDNFSQDRNAASLRAPQLFQNQNAGALAYDETVSFTIPRPRGTVRLIVARRQSAHGGESTDSHRRDARLASAADHHVGVAMLNQPERIADGMGTSGAGCRRCRVRSF